MDSTFNMNANIVPQDMTMNAVDWLRIEKLTKKLSKEVSDGRDKKAKDAVDSKGDDASGKLYVVTGPAFVPQIVQENGKQKAIMQYELTGPANSTPVAVPTHMFKVIVAESLQASGKKQYEAAAFLLPNKPIPEERPLTAYQVSVEKVERLTGLQLFPRLKASTVGDLCRTHNCDAKPASLFHKYRQVAQLRAAKSVPELRRTYSNLAEASARDKKPLDEMVRKEFEKRTEELVAASVVEKM